MRFKNYKNSYNGDNRIFYTKEIADMSVRDVFKNKDAIIAQHRDVGIPTENELKSSDNVVYVKEYTREDGTVVHAHYRSKPDGVESNNFSYNHQSGSTTGAAAKVISNDNNGIKVDWDTASKLPEPTDESKGIAGVMKGEPMSKEQAGGKNVNPNYDENKQDGYSKNCQACIAVFEARLRGYDIEALPYSKETHQFIEYHPEFLFINPETKMRDKFTYIEVNNNKDLENWLQENIGINERYMFRFMPVNNENVAHLVCLYKSDSGEFVFNDVMTGKIYGKEFMDNFKYYIDDSRINNKIPYRPSILRIDNKLLNTSILNKVSKQHTNNLF